MVSLRGVPVASLPQQGSHWTRRPWVSRALGACPTWRVGAICGEPQGTGCAGVSVLWGEVTVKCPWLGGAWGGGRRQVVSLACISPNCNHFSA